MGKRWKEKLFSLFTAWVLVILPLTAIPAAAQATTGTLRGVVVDPNGGVVVGASVTAKNEATGTVTSPVSTTGEGTFEFASLLPGSYTVTVESTGFKRSVSTGVQVKAGIVNPVNIKLEAGNVQETVTVVANTEEVVQRDQSQISTTVDTRRIEELPSNAAGSGLDTLALLAPGVIPNNSGGVNTNGTGLSVNGNRARSNNFQIDGADNNDLSVAGPAMFVDNQDQVQEIQVITNNFSAQYGRNQGAIVNYVTKSGTNDFHGSAFEFHRDNSFLDSLDNIEKRGGQLAPNPSLFNVFGGTVGGPLPIPHFGEGGKGWHSGKDRAFFFVSYQGIRNPSTTTLRDSAFAFLPSQFPLLRAAFPGNAVINAITTQSVFAIAPNAHPRTDVANPVATVTLNGQNFQVAQPEYTISTPFTETDYSMRFDFKASNKDNVTVRYEHQKQLFVNTLAGSQLNGFSGDVPASSKNFGGIWTRTINNSMVSEFRAFYQKIGVEFGGCSAISAGCIPSPLQIGSAITNIALPKLNGLTLQSIGPLNVFPQGRDGKVYQVADNLSWSHGKHNFIFGAEYKHLNEVSPFLPNFNGAFGFSSAARLINNAPSSISLTAGDPTLAFTENDQYYFVQDDFKIRPNLTLNLGVRYEYTGQPINILHDQSVARESGSAGFFDPSLPLSVRTVPLIPADKNNFAPRVGFAYTPHFWKSIFGEDATVIRGGYSIAYEPAFYNILQNVQNTAPFSAALALGTNLLPATNSPFPLPGTLTGDTIRAAAASSGVLPLGHLDPRFLTQNIVSPNFHSPYSEQWSLGVQHQFGKNNVAEVRYVGTHGIGLFQNVNGNFFVGPLLNGIPNWEGTGVNMPAFPQFVPPGVTAQHCVDNPATPSNEGACNGRILPQGSLTIRENSAFSIYHAMQTRYNGRFLNNSLTLGAAYTWSRTEDNASEIFPNDIASANAQNPFCITTCEKARSQIDRPHAFSLNFLYDIPFKREQRGFVGRALGGWQLNGVYVLASGQPYTPGQFFNGSVYGLGNAYLTSGDRPFVGNPNVDQRLVALSQLDASLLYGVPVQNINGFYLLNALNSQTDASGNPLAVPVSPNDVRFIVNTPNAARIFGTPFGNAGRNILRGPKLNQLNASLFKNIKINERLSLQLRGEAYNVLNHPNPGYGVNQAGYCPGCTAGFTGATGSLFVEDAGNPGAAFANNQDIELARRVIQLGVRIIF
jgi:outer membrane receptor protein involved in Fe transport